MRSGILILFTILLFSPVFYYFYFTCSIAEAQFEASSNILNISAEAKSRLLRVSVNLLDKDESDEVWYQNKLYDVAQREVIHDTVFVYLAHDVNEEQLLYKGNTVVGGCFGIYSCDLNPPFKAKTAFLQDVNYLSRSNRSEFFFFVNAFNWVECNNTAHDQFNPDIPSPPPWIAVSI